VNAVISKRFAKRQQMQWTKRGVHLLLQTRTWTLDGTLWPLCERWYPGLANDNERTLLKRPFAEVAKWELEAGPGMRRHRRPRCVLCSDLG
jgi:hypothetical protein